MPRSTVLSALALLAVVGVAALTYAQTRATAPALDEETVRELRASADREIRTDYSILLERLGLGSDQNEALLLWLIQDKMDQQWIATAPWTEVRPGRNLSPAERRKRVAAIIGSAKAEEFLQLERHLPIYAEAQEIETLLQLHRDPLSKHQRDKLVELLFTVEQQLPAPPPRSREISIDYVESTVARLNERERHVLELAAGVLSPDQVAHLFDQYEYRAQSRISSLEMQKKSRAEHPEADIPWHYPSF